VVKSSEGTRTWTRPGNDSTPDPVITVGDRSEQRPTGQPIPVNEAAHLT
jgi:hypothetical protein